MKWGFKSLIPDHMFEMVEVKGAALCRYSTSCPHWQRSNPIPKGAKVLRISVSGAGGAGGGATAFYCEFHTKQMLNKMRKFLEEQ